MIDTPISRAVHAVCKEDGQSDAYATELNALIENAMRNNMRDEDISDLLDQIIVDEDIQ